MGTETYEVVWPRSPQAVVPQELATRSTDLNGKTIAFLWDYLFRGDEIFPVIADELTSRYPAIKIIDYDEFGTTHGDGEAERVSALGAELRRLGVYGVVSGMAC